MNVKNIKQSQEILSNLQSWLELQFHKEKLQDNGDPERYSKKLLELSRVAEMFDTGTPSAPSLLERAKLFLSVMEVSSGRIRDYFSSVDFCSEAEVNFYQSRGAWELLTQDLLSLVRLEGGISLFAQWYNGVSIRDDRGFFDTKALDGVLYRVWAAYFRKNPDDPSAHLYRAFLLHRIFVQPIDIDEPEDPAHLEYQINNHLNSKVARKYLSENGREEKNEILSWKVNPSIESFLDEEGNCFTKNDLGNVFPIFEPERYVRTREKIEREINIANRLSDNSSEIRATGILLSPQPVIRELYRLFTQQNSEELAEKAKGYYAAIEHYQKMPGITHLEERKGALKELTLHYLLFARYTEASPRFFSILPCLENPSCDSLSELYPWCSSSGLTDREKQISTGFIECSMSRIVEDCNPAFFARTVAVLTGRPSMEDSIALVAHLQDFWEPFDAEADATHLDSIDIKGISSLLVEYPGYEGSLSQVLEKDGRELFSAKLKLILLEMFSFKEQYSIRKTINNFYLRTAEKRMEQLAEEKYQARIDERNLVISELSHHIKNLNATVREPLENLRNQPGVPENILEDALRGTNLIRNIVNAMNLSIGGAKEDFIFDATHLDDEAAPLESIIWSALFSAIPNMFDGKHFSKFLRNYFPTREAFREAQFAWSEASTSVDHEKKVECLRQYFFDLSVEISGSPELLFGDTKGSATKMLILCQEMMMNAVKYASTIERGKRDVRISVSQNMETVSIMVENGCNTETRLKTAGLGHTVIKNFAKIMGCEPQIQKTTDRYVLSLEFDNFSHSDKGIAS